MIEERILQLMMGNLVGVGFGLLMYRMATTTLKEHTDVIKDLIIELKHKRK